MLADSRLRRILDIVNARGSVSISELSDSISASDSTIRRDLELLDKEGQLNRVYGGAVAIPNDVRTRDDDIQLRQDMNKPEKIEIAKVAATFIRSDDFIYLDAGTTTELMVDYINDERVKVVTSGISHAKKLADKGIQVTLLGGMLKASTESVVGAEAINHLSKYNFTKGFFGTNGVTIKEGFTTPEINEAMLKEMAMKRSKKSFVLADSSKFDSISSIKFGEFNSATIFTTRNIPSIYKEEKNIKEVDEWFLQ